MYVSCCFVLMLLRCCCVFAFLARGFNRRRHCNLQLDLLGLLGCFALLLPLWGLSFFFHLSKTRLANILCFNCISQSCKIALKNTGRPHPWNIFCILLILLSVCAPVFVPVLLLVSWVCVSVSRGWGWRKKVKRNSRRGVQQWFLSGAHYSTGPRRKTVPGEKSAGAAARRVSRTAKSKVVEKVVVTGET